MKIEWDESFSVGNEQIDQQHQTWIKFYNRLDEVLRKSNHKELSKVKDQILAEMSDYADYHFEFEEEYMRSINYPEIDKHWRQHKDFRSEVYKVCRNNEEGTIVLNSEIMDMIKNWLINHIQTYDMAIRDYVAKSEE